MSNAVRKSHIARKTFIPSSNAEGSPDLVLKKMGLKLKSLVFNLHVQPKEKSI